MTEKHKQITKLLESVLPSLEHLQQLNHNKENAEPPFYSQSFLDAIDDITDSLTEVKYLATGEQPLKSEKVYYEASSDYDGNNDRETIGVTFVLNGELPDAAIARAKLWVHQKLNNMQRYYDCEYKIKEGYKYLQEVKAAVLKAQEQYNNQVKFLQQQGIPVKEVKLPVFPEQKLLNEGEVLKVVNDSDF